MRIFRFFVSRILLRRPVFAIGTLVLMLMANYIAFAAARAFFSTQEGYQHTAHLNRSGTFIANLDPQATPESAKITQTSMRHAYSFLNENYHYALYTDGYLTSLANQRHVDVTASYMNQLYSDLNGFPVAEGSGLTFDYRLDQGEAVPVLVGRGLADDYPLESQFMMHDPALNRELTVRVVGVLQENPSHSNYYALDSKQYYNFSIVIPVTEDYIDEADPSFQFNGLMDLILIDTDRAAASRLGAYLDSEIGVGFNFYSQEDNLAFYSKYFASSMSFLGLASGLLLIVIVALSVWGSLAGVRIMIRDFTINLLVGLSYSRTRRLLYAYYAGLSSAALFAIFVMVSQSRLAAWQNRDAQFMVYGFAGLIQMDWLALLVACAFDLLLVVLIVQAVTWRLKRVPISLGVLQ